MNQFTGIYRTLLLVACLAAGCGDAIGTDSERGDSALPDLPAHLEAGKATYEAGCAGCHDTSHEGAPRLGYLAAWSRRMTKGEEPLVANAIAGIDLMPPRGDNPDLTDEQVRQAVRYMLYRAELDIPAGH